MTSDEPFCAACGHFETDHPRHGRCGAAIAERCWCQTFVGAPHVVQWNGCFRGSIEDPRECGWCETCDRDVYDGEGDAHRRTHACE
jgi:hypothetical protein